MKFVYRIILKKGAGGSSFGHRSYPYTDADGKTVWFQTHDEAVKRCEEMNSKLVDRNLRYFVDRQLINA
jgi:hypothetical protein